MPQTATLQLAPKEIPSGAERCVACGLCLPVCPTYRLTQDEAESPRGRIALMRALAQSNLVPSAKLEQHLQHCLVCRACEKACPSYVPYGQLIDAARALIATRKSAAYAGTPVLRFLGWLISSPGRSFRAGKLLYYYQRSGMQHLLRASGLLRLTGIGKLDALLPRLWRRDNYIRSILLKESKKAGSRSSSVALRKLPISRRMKPPFGC